MRVQLFLHASLAVFHHTAPIHLALVSLRSGSDRFIMSVLGTRSTSFSFGQPPAKQPFNFGGGSTAGAAPSSTPTGQQGAGPSFSFGGASQPPNQPAAPAPTSLFGAPSNASKTVGFSFGQPSAAQQQPQQQQQQPQPQTGGLFGGFGQQQQPGQGQAQANQQAPGASLFGSR